MSTSAFGHGLGGETHPPLTLQGRDVTLAINISPSTFDVNDPERYIVITLNESKSQSVVEHVTFAFELSKDGEQIFRRFFHDDLGNLVIKVIQDNSDTIQINGNKSPGIEAWMRTPTDPVTMTGPIFTKGGLYEYKIEIVTVDSDLNFLDIRYELEGAISLAEHNLFNVTDSKQITHQMNVISYYDKIENFGFSSNKVSFSMPFDWNQDWEQFSVVHEEIRIPQELSDFIHTKYQAKVNGIQLKDDMVTIDDFSLEDRIVHLVINKENIKQIKEEAKKKSDSKMFFEIEPNNDRALPLEEGKLEPKNMQDVVSFPIKLDSISKSNPNKSQYSVDLTWFPNILGLGESEFVMTFYEKDSRIPVKNAKYDFILMKDGSTIYHKSGVAKAGGTFENFVFVEGEIGDVTLRIENIAGSDEYVEIPIKVTPEFPLGITILIMAVLIPTIILSKTKFFKNYSF